jgi:DNA polymerase-4
MKGKVTERKMLGQGIKTGYDLKKMQQDELINLFGKSGTYFYNIAHCEDDRPVSPFSIRKSIGKETTLSYDITDIEQIIRILQDIALKIETLLKKYDLKGITVTLKIKYFDFQSITRSITTKEFLDEATIIMKYIKYLIEGTEVGIKKVRLLGITISNFLEDGNMKYRQLPLPF